MVNNQPSCYLCGREMRHLFDKEGHPLFGCGGCRIQCLFPQPDDATLSRIYGKSYYDVYGSGEVLEDTLRMKRRTFAHLIDHIGGLTPGSSLLDCGAAIGILVDFAARRGVDAYAVELSDYG